MPHFPICLSVFLLAYVINAFIIVLLLKYLKISLHFPDWLLTDTAGIWGMLAAFHYLIYIIFYVVISFLSEPEVGPLSVI